MAAERSGPFVVIGGVAAGMSAASQVRRRSPEREVVALEKGNHVSYGSCGMPYNLMDPKRDMEDLVVISAERFRRERGVDVRTGHEAVGLDLARRVVHVRDHGAGRDYELPWEDVAFTTGARPVVPEVPGVKLPGVHALRNIGDGMRLKAVLGNGAPRSVLVVGGGYIAMEMTEAFRALGLDVTVVVRRDRVLPRGYVDAASAAVEEALVRHDVRIVRGARVLGVREREGRAAGLDTSQGPLDGDMVVFATGVRPNSELAAQAGVGLGVSGAIAVDQRLQTDVEGVWAAGDCAHVTDLVTGQPTYLPQGTTANKQGRVLGANVAGADMRFEGVVGTSVFRVFELQVAQTGITAARAAEMGLETVSGQIEARTRAHSYPGGGKTLVHLLAEKGSGRLFGAQIVGPEGVKGRIDVLATALHAGMTLDQIGWLDLAYTPPLSPVWDPVLTAAQVLAKRV